LAEIKIASFNFPPKGWALCNGQLLPINQNQALFSLLGTTYGGNGQTNFALPDLRGRVPMHMGSVHIEGERAGSASVTVTTSTMPAHTHVAQASQTNGDTNAPGGHILAASPIYAGPANFVSLNPGTITSVGGSQPHENRHPFLVLNFCIALQGIFPSRN
jgi:microcystin-dependent protein